MQSNTRNNANISLTSHSHLHNPFPTISSTYGTQQPDRKCLQQSSDEDCLASLMLTHCYPSQLESRDRAQAPNGVVKVVVLYLTKHSMQSTVMHHTFRKTYMHSLTRLLGS